jgi:fumarate hydratase class II
MILPVRSSIQVQSSDHDEGQVWSTDFVAQGSLDAMVAASAALRTLAVALMKIANDLRWLRSRPVRTSRTHPTETHTWSDKAQVS